MKTRPMNHRHPGNTGIQRTKAFLAGTALGVAVGFPALASPFDATPADNNAIAATQGALMGAHIGGMIGGIAAPSWFGTGFEVAAMAADIGLKNTPAIFEIPDSRTLFPNAVRMGSFTGVSCVYKFQDPVRNGLNVTGDDYPLGIEEGFSSIFYVPFNPLDEVYADLGHPLVYHTGADVNVRARNPYLGVAGYADYDPVEQRLLQQKPEFPAGQHDIKWEATTSMNVVLDVTVPSVLIGIGAAAENYAGKKALAASAKGAAKPLSVYAGKAALFAADLGLIASDISSVFEGAQWYQDTSFDTASNRATQQFTVYDTALPYVRSRPGPGPRITSQDIVLEATDFGGVRLGRVEEELQTRFEPFDDCGESFALSNDSPSTRLFPIDVTETLVWDIREVDGGPYAAAMTLGANQEREGESLVTRFTQRIRVEDTQAPILIAPSGFARYDEDGIDLEAEEFPLGRPRVVDLADPAPIVENNAPNFLAGPGPDVTGVRYDITWDATDSSGNSALAEAQNTSKFVQTITLKKPGTNTVPQATAASASTLTAQTVDIVLTGVDNDLIDGRVDPLAFEIEDLPANGQFDAPLYPYFIEDFRLTPVGEREEGDNTTRVSPLRHLAEDFSNTDSSVHGTFLNQNICNAAPGSLNDTEFGGVIPVNMVYEPSYLYVDDAGFYYIRDMYYACGETPITFGGSQPRGELAAVPRLSKWTETGGFVKALPLVETRDPNDDDSYVINLRPTPRFSVDQENRIWVEWSPTFSTFGGSSTHYSFDNNFENRRFHGTVNYTETETIFGEGLRGIASDSNTDLLFEVTRTAINVRNNNDLVELGNDAPSVGELDISEIVLERLPSGVPVRGESLGGDPVVDRDGNFYLLDAARNRIHKWAPTTADGAGGWNFGAYIGWMGSCTTNKTIDGTPNGVPFNACDDEKGTSRGYGCSDARCNRAADTSGAAPGQFDSPISMEIDPNDVLYVADTGNSRVQRFGPDGTFAGEAKSTGTGINQGDQPGFVLGNMGEPEWLSVNSTAFFVMERLVENGDYFVNVFKTSPFRDVTDSSATVRYVSDFNFQGNDQFSYVVDDGIDESVPATVDVTVTRAFRPPENLSVQCFADTDLVSEIFPCSLDEDTSIIIRLSATDPDGFISDPINGLDSHTFEVITGPSNGTQVVADPALVQDNATVLRYTPNQNFNGTDSFEFRVFDGAVYSETSETVELIIRPVADPVVVEFDDNLRAARGFPTVFKADFSDADELPDQQPSVYAIDWDDGTVVATVFNDWQNSGQEDLNGREIKPQVDFGRGSGLILGSHNYATTGNYQVAIGLDHHPSDFLPPITYSTQVEVVEVTAVGIALAAPASDVMPDVPFALTFNVENLEPSSWPGLVAGDVSIAFDVPDGVALTAVDSRCTGSTRISCALGDMDPGSIIDVTFTAEVSLAAARDQASYNFVIDIVDNGPNLMSENSANLSFDVLDTDGDGVIDALDAFIDDARYDTDTDGDGLADDWEREVGLDPTVADDGSADTDGDGFTLLQEFANNSFPKRADREVFVTGGRRLEIEDYSQEDRLGLAMAGADFNDDGFTDLLIGASAYEDAALTGDGAVFISWGSANGASTALQRLRDPNAATPFGTAIASGDWDDNGLPDVAIAGGNLVYIHWNNGEILERADETYTFSDSTSGLSLHNGDIDNDGLDDLVVAYIDNGDTGLAIFASGNGGLDVFPEILTLPGTSYRGPTFGDFDGDSQTDITLGDSVANIVRGYLGAENDWSAATGLVESFALTAPTGQSRFGYATAGGDVTGDGIDDLVVGAYTGGGFVNLYASESLYFTGNAALPIQTIAGEPVSTPGNGTHGDQFGVALDVANLDRDPYADIAIGANRAGGQDEGQIRILRGSPTGFVSSQIQFGSTPFDLLGHNVVIPGDMDGDGVADIAGAASDTRTTQNPSPDGGYVQIYYHAFETRDAGDDDDDDGVGLALDNCINDANTNQADIDGDGEGDACDADIDGDGFDNSADNCPLIASTDTTDTDGDLDGDLCDSDDDNDAVADEDDAFPLDPLYSEDSDGDGMADAWERDNGLDPSSAADGQADLDGDGRSNREEFEQGSDVAADDVAPEITVPANRIVNSIGPWTPVNLGSATANDGLDGAVEVSPNRSSPFRPGRHVVTWSSTDAAGNAAQQQQTIDVIPQVGFVGDTALVAEASVSTISVALNGDAVTYPVTVPYTVSGTAAEGADYTIDAGDVVIDASNVGGITLTTLADALVELDETVELTLGTPTNAVSGGQSRFDVRIVDGNLAPRPSLAIEQDGRRVTTVTRDGAAVVVSVLPEDPNAGDTHSYDWRASDAGLQPQEGFNASTFTIDPSTLVEGIYRVAVTVTDDGLPAAVGAQYRYLRVVATQPPLSADTDSDGDGIDDVSEGLRDSNDNGTSDYLDPVNVSHELLARLGSNALLQAANGYTLSLGRVALASGDDASVSILDIADFGNDGQSAVNSTDAGFSYPAGLFDFELSGLPVGGHIAKVVIPQNMPLPANGSYRKYAATTGWTPFVTDGSNSVESAPGEAGICPSPGSAAYRPGLNAGDNCVQLTLQDGGPNDADGLANGSIRDPGGVAVAAVTAAIDAAALAVTDQTVATGDTDVVMARFRLSSNTSTVELDDLTLRASGSGDDNADIKAVKLWVDANGDGALGAGDVEIGAGTYSADNGDLTITMPTPYRLDAGMTDFIVSYSF